MGWSFKIGSTELELNTFDYIEATGFKMQIGDEFTGRATLF